MHESAPFESVFDDDDPLPEFTPVPLSRSRRDGWTAERQRAFVAALARTGVVAAATRAAALRAADRAK